MKWKILFPLSMELKSMWMAIISGQNAVTPIRTDTW
jgi:hypothetical protein